MKNLFKAAYHDHMKNLKYTILILAMLIVNSLYVGCDTPPVREEVIPSVKVFTVSKKSEGQLRKISGKVYAGKESNLSFGVGGRVKEIIVSEGETVVKGQLLARLDGDTFRIRVEDARAKLNNARAKIEDTRATYERNEKLYKKRAVSRKELESAILNLSTAEGSLKTAQANLSQAELDLKRAKLTAPFAGKIDKVLIDPFQEVSAGDKIINIQSDKKLEVRVRVPETLIRYLDFGQVVKVIFPTMSGVSVSGTVATIAAEAEEGNSFSVTINLVDQGNDLRPGMSASVLFDFDKSLEGQTVYMIPISAIAIDAALLKPADYSRDEISGRAEAPVFILNSEEGIIHERKVLIGDLRGNDLEVFRGLSEGDLVVSAGISFLRDGMKARAWISENTKEKKRGK